jgi:succinate dehydrogenase / fumarate reductase cytochrome b subunit
MLAARRIFTSSIGTKILIGATGLALFAYLILHVAGNLLIFLGPRVFNRYAHVLTANPLVPIIEIGLLLVFLLHVYKTIRMYLANLQARPVPYVRKVRAGPPSRKTLASSTMILSGLWLLVFVIIHVRTFKYGPVYELDTPSGAYRDLYRVEVENFSQPLIVAFYVLSMLVVGSHLWHGVASGFQSLGADAGGGRTWTARLLLFSKSIAVVIAGGFIVIALWVFFTLGRG